MPSDGSLDVVRKAYLKNLCLRNKQSIYFAFIKKKKKHKHLFWVRKKRIIIHMKSVSAMNDQKKPNCEGTLILPRAAGF